MYYSDNTKGTKKVILHKKKTAMDVEDAELG